MPSFFQFFVRKYLKADYEFRQKVQVFLIMDLLCAGFILSVGIMNAMRGLNLESTADFFFVLVCLFLLFLVYHSFYEIAALIFLFTGTLLNFYSSYLTVYHSILYIYNCTYPALFILILSFLITYRKSSIIITGFLNLISILVIFYIKAVLENKFYQDKGMVTELIAVIVIYGLSIYFCSFIYDILKKSIQTARDSENAAKNSLEIKDSLLKELFHRIKNNMQVICSLLSIQSSIITEAEMKRILKDMEYRIRTMALVHEKLYKSRNLSSISVNEYIRDLSSLLMHHYRDSYSKVALELDLPDIKVTIDTGIPCGLILNELISNSLRHAFAGQKNGIIRIKMTDIKKKGRILLEYSDNGHGFPADFDWRHLTKLGLLNVMTLSEHQLGGKIEIKTGSGFNFELEFPARIYEERV